MVAADSSRGVVIPFAEPGEDGASPDRLRFRILKRGDWRRAIKLEEIFWKSLEEMAAQEGLKLTDYVRSVLDALPDHANQTAELRAHVARRLHDRLAETQERLAGSGASGMLQAAPVPGFVTGPGLGLIAYNGEFLRLIRRAAAREEHQGVPQARLNLDAPLSHIVDLLARSRPRPLECGFTLTVDHRAMRGRVRVCLMPGPNGREDLMGFVSSIRDGGDRPAGGMLGED